MTDKFQQFSEQVSASPELKQKVSSSIGDLKYMAEIAQQEGYDITFEELKNDLQSGVAKFRDKPEVKAFVAQHPEAHRFYYKGFNDEALHSRFVAANGDANKLAALATEEGFDLDAAKIEAFHIGLMEATSTGELSDEELDAVAGGGFLGALVGGLAGAVGGFVGGFVVDLADGKSLADAAVGGAKYGAASAVTGAIAGAATPVP